MPNYKLAIVIINYKTPDLVIQCLETLLPQLNSVTDKVILIDNYSQDNSIETLQAWISKHDPQQQIQFIAATNNSGFSGGNNLGIQAVTADYYLLLNSDTLLRPNSILTLLETTKQFPDAGLISPRLEWQDGIAQKSCFIFHSPISEFIQAARTGIITKLFKKYDVPLTVSNQISQPNWTSFACVLLKGAMIQQIGLMDEGYFLYYEDVDYCQQAQKYGWQIVHNPAAQVIHLQGGSSTIKNNLSLQKRVPKYYYASRSRYFYKHCGHLGLFSANMLWMLGRSISWLREQIERRPTHVCAQQWRDIWTNFINPTKNWHE